MAINSLHDFTIHNSFVYSFSQLNNLHPLFNAKSISNANEICLKGALDLLQYVNWLQHFVHLSCLSSKHLADVSIKLSLTDWPIVPGIGADVDVQHPILNLIAPGIMDVATQMDGIPIIIAGPVPRNFSAFEARVIRRVVPNRNDIASNLSGQCPANAANVVVRIMVALQEDNLSANALDVFLRLGTTTLTATVLAVVHEVAYVDEQIVRLDPLLNSTNQSSIVLLHGLEGAVCPFNNAGCLGGLKVKVASEKGLHC